MTGISRYYCDTFQSHLFSAIFSMKKTKMMSFMLTIFLLAIHYDVEAAIVGLTVKGYKRRMDAYDKCCRKLKCFYPKRCNALLMLPAMCKCLPIYKGPTTLE